MALALLDTLALRRIKQVKLLRVPRVQQGTSCRSLAHLPAILALQGATHLLLDFPSAPSARKGAIAIHSARPPVQRVLAAQRARTPL